MTRKVLLIGVDGADWSLLDGWVEAGYLPNIAALIKNGSKAPLNSVAPLNSASAWVSIITGRNPGAHGIFGFTKEEQGTYRRRAVSSSDICAATLWEIANASDEPVGIVNCPITYPPPVLNGFAVSGILIPYNDLWAYPPEVENDLRGLFGHYMVDVSWNLVDESTPGEREKFFADLYLMTKKQEEVALKLMASKPWTIFGMFFTGTDRIMHRFWHYIDENHPLYNAEAAKIYGDEIRKYFSMVDDMIGRMLEKAPDAQTIVVSDHGFGPLYRRFYLRKWLAERKYLSETRRTSRYDADDELKGIDFRKTKAYPASLSESGIRINLKGEKPHGIVSGEEYEKVVNSIIDDLNNLKIDGRKPVKRAVKREDVLTGDFVKHAPDILIETNDLFIVDSARSNVLLSLTTRETGAHRPQGIFVASGSLFKSGANPSNLNIVDVLPTALAAADIPIPEDLEGRVIAEAFDKAPPIKTSPPVEIKRGAEASVSSDEDEKKKKLLRGLGYL